MGLDNNEHHLKLGQEIDHMSEDISIDYDDPIFYKQPRDAFVIKSRPATLHCRVSQALDIHFKVGISYQKVFLWEHSKFMPMDKY